MRSALAIRREYGRVKQLHFANVRQCRRKNAPSERDYYMAMGAHQALAWATEDNAQRPSIACAPLPKLTRRSK